jgi:hypothetical protein
MIHTFPEIALRLTQAPIEDSGKLRDISINIITKIEDCGNLFPGLGLG